MPDPYMWDGQRWVSTDQRWYWDAGTWKRLGGQPLPGWLAGCVAAGLGLGVAVLAVGILGFTLLFASTGMEGATVILVSASILGVALCIALGFALVILFPRHWYLWPLIATWPWLLGIITSVPPYFDPHMGAYHVLSDVALPVTVSLVAMAALVLGAVAARLFRWRRVRSSSA